MTTNGNEYRPTAAEEKLLLVLLNPDNIGLTVTEKCSKAGVDRGVYYDAMKKREFVEMLNALTMDMLKGEMNDIIKVFAKKAKEGSYNHGKLLLEMGNLYTNKQIVEGNLQHNVSIEDVIAALDKDGDKDESNGTD